MNALDLETLRTRWSDSGRTLDANLTLDPDAVRAALAGHTARAFRRHSRWLWPGIVAAGAALLALLWFISQQWRDPIYLLPAAVLALMAAAEIVVGVRQWRALTRLDFSRPALEVQQTLDTLRSRRLWLTRWIMLLSVLMWLPAIAVLVKALFGADLLRGMHPSFVIANLVVGVLFVPFALLLGRFALRRFVGESGMQRFLDESIGGSWTRAQQQWRRQQQATADNDDELLVPRIELPDHIAQASRRLQRRLLIGTVLCAGVILAIGAFNATHGGEWSLLVPGVVLNLLVVAHMVGQILHRLQLRRMDGLMSAAVLHRHLQDMIRMRENLARATLVLAPLLALPLLQVATRVLFGLSLHELAGPVVVIPAGLLAVLASVWLWLRWLRDPDGFLPRAVDVLSGGALHRTRALQQQL